MNLLVQGRAKPPQITLTSQPPLSQREIVSLLALGVTGTAMDCHRFGPSGRRSFVGRGRSPFAKSRRAPPERHTRPGCEGVLLAAHARQRFAPESDLIQAMDAQVWRLGSRTIRSLPTNQVKLQYKMNKNTSVIGSFDGKETSPQSTESTTQNVLGLDLEYRVGRSTARDFIFC